jgi:DNA-directed RNA polymerase specialized sigma subunit
MSSCQSSQVRSRFAATHGVVEDSERAVETEVLGAAAVEALGGLLERERFAIQQRVVLERPLKDVGAELGVSPQRVIQRTVSPSTCRSGCAG